MDAQAGTARRPDEIHSIEVKGQRLRVAIRPGNGTRVPLLLMNGIGVSLEVFQPFIDELDPGIEVIRSLSYSQFPAKLSYNQSPSFPT